MRIMGRGLYTDRNTLQLLLDSCFRVQGLWLVIHEDPKLCMLLSGKPQKLMLLVIFKVKRTQGHPESSLCLQYFKSLMGSEYYPQNSREGIQKP